MNGLIQEGLIPFTTSGAPPAETFYILAEDGSAILAETGDHILSEDAP